MKKTPTKSAKTTKETPVPTPAPAAKTSKATKPAAKAVPTTTKAPAILKPLKVTKVVKSTKAPKASAPVAPLVKAAESTPVVTSITAEIDVGFGNTLYIRGEGPGLSWDRGVPLESAAPDVWQITLAETSRPIIFKFLVNDLSWSAGSDYVSLPGATLVLRPVF